jgi:hypothetical protein
MFRLTKKRAAIGLFCISVIGADIGYGFFYSQFWGTFNCLQPPRSVNWETLTLRQRVDYGYPDPAAVKINSQANNDYQLHGVHYCR